MLKITATMLNILILMYIDHSVLLFGFPGDISGWGRFTLLVTPVIFNFIFLAIPLLKSYNLFSLKRRCIFGAALANVGLLASLHPEMLARTQDVFISLLLACTAIANIHIHITRLYSGK